ncbi:NADH-quinone oxidoreductase subunit L [Enterobacteriaceae endosymbiont of Donacia bicoloricornis]|uniref:NADH-quinone oxidoreductase subunit L n=1 Tax=Enterobacteriaceae endosymbiont of Donacia bicoloricornis TaxID=2675772 RepID=UPI00144A1B9F|nr:NADH-quinone oxidoreductase subunit L [Enterobacteriaceae endosymbiont of Donacia bicoloricornis]QJC37872.1 NADH-quinone oxidoreductase subunit L [Enterobacteriaceae endosymbiont of Donacia bicoloricornis]
MNFLFLIILMPLISFVILSLFSKYLNKTQISIIGISFIGISAILALIIGFIFIKNNGLLYKQTLWKILDIDYLYIDFSLYLDKLSLIMLLLITWVGFIIHIFSIWYMENKEGYSRFFAYTNLFISNMILLILANNFILMFFGWEGVGVCSYLLIGFFNKKLKNGLSAIKAFLITRFSDIFLIIGIFLIFKVFHTLNFSKISYLITSSHIYYKSYYLKIISIMLIIGSLGKSAQFPLNTWLIDAMAGPTPVSSMIHAATMVTAGIYLILRNNILFLMNDNILFLTSIIGSITLLLSGWSALIQNNIKNILAYSTMSQLGYMFLALGIHSFHATLFHIISHAFFKALLFLCAASIITSCNNEQNIFKIGKTKKYFPFIYYYFLCGALSLMSLPFITMSSFTKEKILYEILINKHILLFIIGIIGSFFTCLYTIRMIYIIFYGQKIILPIINNKFAHNFPLVILSILSSNIGIKLLPRKNSILFPNKMLFLKSHFNHMLEIVSIIIFIISFILYIFYIKKNNFINKVVNYYYKFSFINNFFLNGCYIDFIYKKIFVNIFLKILLIIKNDPIARFIDFLTIKTINKIGNILLLNQNGYIRWYISSIYLGIILIILYLIILINY